MKSFVNNKNKPGKDGSSQAMMNTTEREDIFNLIMALYGGEEVNEVFG